MAKEGMAGQRFIEARSTVDQRLLRADVPNVVTISNENGTQWLGSITEFHQYQTLLEWAVSSKDAGELLPLPNEFREHILHPFRDPEASGSLLAFSKNRGFRVLQRDSLTNPKTPAHEAGASRGGTWSRDNELVAYYLW